MAAAQLAAASASLGPRRSLAAARVLAFFLGAPQLNAGTLGGPPMSATQATAWRGAIGAEAGPVIVTNADDFEAWTGADALPASERTHLHLWSPFTRDLPAQFRPREGQAHQFVPAPDYPGLAHLRDELLRFVEQKWPGTTVTFEHDRWTAKRPDGRLLRVEFYPTSEYDRAIRDLLYVKATTFAVGRVGIVFSVEPGMVEIVRQPSGDLALVQVLSVPDARLEASAIQDVLNDESFQRSASEAVLVIDPGPIVVAWAPQSARDLTTHRPSRTPMDPGKRLDFGAIAGSGATLAVPSGLYSVWAGERRDGDFYVLWCRFLRA